MEFEILGRSPEGPTLDLSHEQFAYAGKFVMSSTGKSVVRDDGAVIGAIAFSEDHADPDAVRLRYVTVREDRRGDGIGPRLLRFTADTLGSAYDRVLIAVNNPIAYQACYRAGFAFTGEETGMAELLLAYAPGERSRMVGSDPDGSGTVHDEGLAAFEGRDLPPAQRAVVDRHRGSDPPPIVDSPASGEMEPRERKPGTDR
jgi:GNAT superfamily N-acetyltransferase